MSTFNSYIICVLKSVNVYCKNFIARYGNDRYALSLAAAISNTGNSAGATLETPAFNVSGYYAPNGDRAQWSGAVTAKIPVKNKTLSITVDNDFFLSWRHKDEWNTGAVEFSYDGYTAGALVVTNNIKAIYDSDNRENKNEIYKNELGTNLSGKLNRNNNGSWIGGNVLFSPAYIGTVNGNQVSRFGYSHKRVQDFLQNNIHRSRIGFMQSPYFNDYSEFRSGFWGQSRNAYQSSLY